MMTFRGRNPTAPRDTPITPLSTASWTALEATSRRPVGGDNPNNANTCWRNDGDWRRPFAGNNNALERRSRSAAARFNPAPRVTIPNLLTRTNSFTIGTNPLNFSSLVATNAAGTITVNNTGGATFSGVIVGSSSLALAGSGTVFLPNPNLYTGGTTLSSATLTVVVGHNSAFSTGAIALGGAILVASGPRTITNALTLNGGGVTTFAGDNASPFTFTGAITASVATTVVAQNATTWSGTITGASQLTVNPGFGVLTITGNNSPSFTGPVVLNSSNTAGSAGVLVVGSNTALGTGALTLQSGVLRSTGNSRY